jgi:hypothetical protein
MKRCLLKNLASAAFLIFSAVISFTSCNVKASDIKAVGYFPGEGIKALSLNSWNDFNEGLPKDLVAEYIAESPSGIIYLATEYSGIFKRGKADKKWTDLSTKILRRRTQLAGVNEFRKISAFCIDPQNENHLVLATKHTLYSSNDGGVNWEQVVIKNNKNSYYFTSLVLKSGTLYAGTSFNGVIVIKDNTAKEINKGVPKEYYAGDLNFCEGVSALADAGGILYSGYLFGRGVCFSKDGLTWSVIDLPPRKRDTEGIYNIVPYKGKIIISSDDEIYEYDPADKSILVSNIGSDVRKTFGEHGPQLYFLRTTEKNPPLFIRRNITKYTIDGASKAGSKRALYVSWSMINAGFNKFLDIAVRNNFNAVIIDVKDDYGIINAPIESKIAKEIGAIRNTNIKEIIEKLHAKGIYVIARNVTFKDKKLYSAYKSKYAIWDKVDNQPWVGLPRERWCDPYSQFVRDYNIEVARETAKLGFDEIQFDYIRFPTDGATARCQFRYKENSDTFKSEIMGDFLMQARKEAGVPISIDIYGYNGWYRFGNLIGQDIEFLSRFVDVVCPMVYPSHFGARFYNRFPVDERPFTIVKDSTIRGIYLSHNRAVIRPWIQGFNYASPTWGPAYIVKQIQGVMEGGGLSYSFWNPAGDHSMTDRALQGKGIIPEK